MFQPRVRIKIQMFTIDGQTGGLTLQGETAVPGSLRTSRFLLIANSFMWCGKAFRRFRRTAVT